MVDIGNKNEKKSDEKNGLTFHYNPGNMSGKTIEGENTGPRPRTDRTSEEGIRSVMKAVTDARAVLARYADGDDDNAEMVIDELLKILNGEGLSETMKRVEMDSP